MDWLVLPFTKYAQFSGRSSRKEYWIFVGSMLTTITVLMLIESFLGTSKLDYEQGAQQMLLQPLAVINNAGPLTMLFVLGTIIPFLSVGVRRLHDVNRSGWLLLVILIPVLGQIVLLYFFLQKGTASPNRFGDEPNPEEEVKDIHVS